MVARSAATLITHPFHGRCPLIPGEQGTQCQVPLVTLMSLLVSLLCHSRVPAVITLRCMVQFIGRETKYRYGLWALGAPPGGLGSWDAPDLIPPLSPSPSGTLSAFATIYREEGILGFFA